eukprot:TRINITY_DN3666_c0_g1_i1.p1 TRINITY_DN3666_c0_g1~~TRINITY_DN3666_c0_g1_i1.p1  ORF type:complete len:421 (-),score=31.85 TRINITY_DN3666_c0_g1_i1:157-1359(-)
MSAQLVAVQAINFRKVWDDRGTGSEPFDGAFFRPLPPPGYHSVGDVCCGKNEKSGGYIETPDKALLVVAEVVPALPPGATYVPLLVPPIDFEPVWNDKGTCGKFNNFSLWKPVAPGGYVAMGCVVNCGYEKPYVDSVRCVHQSQLLQGVVRGPNQFTWHNPGNKGRDGPVTCWTPLPSSGGVAVGTFVAARGSNLPGDMPLVCLYQASLQANASAPQVRVVESDFKGSTLGNLFGSIGSAIGNVQIETNPVCHTTTTTRVTVVPSHQHRGMKPGDRVRLRSHATNKHVRIQPCGTVDANGGNGPKATFEVIGRGCGAMAFRNVKDSCKYLRIKQGGNVDGNGSGGRLCDFKVIRHGRGEISLQSSQCGRYLSFGCGGSPSSSTACNLLRDGRYTVDIVRC